MKRHQLLTYGALVLSIVALAYSFFAPSHTSAATPPITAVPLQVMQGPDKSPILNPVKQTGNIAVFNAMTISDNGGESQSTVVAPQLKSQCQNGRFLVTNDFKHPPEDGVVSGRDLDKTAGSPTTSKFEMGWIKSDVDSGNYVLSGTADHDLVSLSNGDVLYITAAFSKTALPRARLGGVELPRWMSSMLGNAYREDLKFGPNARTVMLVFRSTDCGENFKFLSEMDPLRFEGGTCALPQPPVGKDGHYNMGGTDGPLIKVDPRNDRIYMTHECVGNLPADESKKLPGLGKKINKTLVLMSDTNGESWKSLGYIDMAAWRLGVVPMADGELIFSLGDSLLRGKQDATGKLSFPSTAFPASTQPQAWWGYKTVYPAGPNSPLNQGASTFASDVIARANDSKSVVLAFPDKFPTFPSKVFGYRVFFFDQASGKFAQGTSILPVSPQGVAFHLAVSDPGVGPVLLYWTDLNSSSKKITVRGRLIIGKGKFSEDFTISRVGGAAHSFPVMKGYWIGDYHTAGATALTTKHTTGSGPIAVTLSETTRYDYYPMWIEGDNLVHYTRVEYAVDSSLFSISATGPERLGPERSGPSVRLRPLEIRDVREWKPGPPPVELRNIRLPSRDKGDEYDRVRRIKTP